MDAPATSAAPSRPVGFESHSPRLGRAEWGKHHHISARHLGAYVREMAWREDTRRRPDGTPPALAAGAALGHPASRMWKGFRQRAHQPATSPAKGAALTGTDPRPGDPARPCAPPMHFFLHVPKTAGTTLNALIAGLFPGAAAWHQALVDQAGGEAALAAAIAADDGFYDHLAAVVGHFGVRHPLVAGCERRAVLFAVLREPVERVVSLYEYIRRTQDHPIHREARERTLMRCFEELPSFRANATDAQLNQVFGAADPDGVRAALAGRAYVLGRFDRIVEFVAAVEAATGRRHEGEVPRLNAGGRDPALVPAREQPDYAEAVAAVSAASAREVEFYRRMPAVLGTATVVEPWR